MAILLRIFAEVLLGHSRDAAAASAMEGASTQRRIFSSMTTPPAQPPAHDYPMARPMETMPLAQYGPTMTMTTTMGTKTKFEATTPPTPKRNKMKRFLLSFGSA